MLQLTLDRIGEDDAQTYGVIKVGQTPRFVTCEDLWRDNQRSISCIPVGSYRCVEHDSPRFGSTYLVTNVPGRSHILFHPGNRHVDTEGCILVGSSFSNSWGGSGITNSRLGFSNFLRLLREHKEFILLVQNLMTAHNK